MLSLLLYLTVAGVGFALGRLYEQTKAHKGLILAFLQHRGEMPGAELRKLLGAGVYLGLYELEKEGLVESRSDGIEHPERGGLPRRFYKLAGQA